MRNQNRIDVTLTKPLEETHNCVQRKSKSNAFSFALIQYYMKLCSLQLEKTDLMKLFNLNALKSIVQKVSTADIVEVTSNSSVESDITETVMLANRMQRRRLNHQQHHTNTAQNGTDRCCIDGKSFYMSRHEINQKANDIIEQHFDRNFSIKEVCSINETSYHKWIAEQQQKKTENKEVAISIEADEISEHSSRKSPISISYRGRRQRALRSRQNPTLVNLFGYMYGKFTKPRVLPSTATLDRFGIPLSTIDKALKHQQKQTIQENVLRKVRLAQMGYQQPPAKEDSSDDESVQNVKRLALLRTPYFLIPMIRISQVKRKERFRNKFLQKDRLNRINLLLFEHHKKSRRDRSGKTIFKRNLNVHFERTTGKKFNFLSKCLFLKCGRKLFGKTESNPIKQKYKTIIQTKFKQQIKKCASSVGLLFL